MLNAPTIYEAPHDLAACEQRWVDRLATLAPFGLNKEAPNVPMVFLVPSLWVENRWVHPSEEIKKFFAHLLLVALILRKWSLIL